MSGQLIFIVAYNHQKTIEQVIARIPPPILNDRNTEILIIDDGSSDGTFDASEAVRRRLGEAVRLTVLKNPVNQGYGGNQKLGYRYAIDRGFDRVILLHGDGQYAPERLTDFLEAYAQAPAPDAVFGTRMSSWGSPLKGGMPLYKFVGNKILTWIQNRLLRSRYSEFHSGYRSYSTSLLKRIPFEVNSNGFDFDTEIFIQCIAAGARIVELPIPTYYGDEICYVNGMGYARDVVIASARYRIQQLGLLYDRRFDVAAEPSYPPKASRFSSHAKIASRVPPRSRVLDIGCGRGNVASRLIEKGCIVDGIDLLPAAALDVKLRRYERIDLTRDLDAVARVVGAESYDYIVLADILEHLSEPEKLLDVIRASHRRDVTPTVVASTGNVAFLPVRGMLALGQFNYGTRGILDRTHRILFTPRSFRHLFRQWGYAIVDREGITMPLTEVAGPRAGAAAFLERLGDSLARFWPTMCAYQVLVVAKPLPTVQQLLEISSEFSTGLRAGASDSARVAS